MKKLDQRYYQAPGKVLYWAALAGADNCSCVSPVIFFSKLHISISGYTPTIDKQPYGADDITWSLPNIGGSYDLLNDTDNVGGTGGDPIFSNTIKIASGTAVSKDSTPIHYTYDVNLSATIYRISSINNDAY